MKTGNENQGSTTLYQPAFRDTLQRLDLILNGINV